jgi:bisphosphoglycerate-independent phosphoglycerate mutase (AlkP superfamily)
MIQNKEFLWFAHIHVHIINKLSKLKVIGFPHQGHVHSHPKSMTNLEDTRGSKKQLDLCIGFEVNLYSIFYKN